MTQTGAESESTALVLKDAGGDYIVVPQEVLERCRLPREHNAEVERALAERDDTAGYLGPLIVAGALVFTSGFLNGFLITSTIVDEPKGTLGPALHK